MEFDSILIEISHLDWREERTRQDVKTNAKKQFAFEKLSKFAIDRDFINSSEQMKNLTIRESNTR